MGLDDCRKLSSETKCIIEMNKIIYLIEQPLDERNFSRFGIQNWIDNGWHVEIWDLTPLVYPAVWQHFNESEHQFVAYNEYYPVMIKNDLSKLYKTHKVADYFVDLTGISLDAIRVKLYLIRAGAIRITCSSGDMPTVDFKKSRVSTSKLTSFTFSTLIRVYKEVLQKIAYRLIRHYFKSGITVVAGKKSLSESQAGYTGRDIIKAHNFDFDTYLNLSKSNSIPSNCYAVFIDQDMCFHPDVLYNSGVAYATPEQYFPTICHGLETISDFTGVVIKIAAHPRSTYSSQKVKVFRDIPIEYGKTAELIYNAKFIMCHYSTAIQLGILFKKPIIFITTDEFELSFISSYMRKLAGLLGKRVINLDSDLSIVNWGKELKVDSNKYDEYIDKYIKISGSDELPFWDIVLNHIKSVDK
ncbi:hypothetical protein N9735_01360 [Oceanospirillaceae bacterium]|nr:hypothetical protein [Oceanospirillaceae bacterium]